MPLIQQDLGVLKSAFWMTGAYLVPLGLLIGYHKDQQMSGDASSQRLYKQKVNHVLSEITIGHSTLKRKTCTYRILTGSERMTASTPSMCRK